MYFYQRSHYKYSPVINTLLDYNTCTDTLSEVIIDVRTGNLENSRNNNYCFFVNIRISHFKESYGEVAKGYQSIKGGINFLTGDLFRLQTNAIKIWEF